MERDTQYVIWQNSLKSAISLEDLVKVQELLDSMPTSDDIDIMSTNLALLDEAIKLYELKQQKILIIMKNIQKSKQFVLSQKSINSKKIIA